MSSTQLYTTHTGCSLLKTLVVSTTIMAVLTTPILPVTAASTPQKQEVTQAETPMQASALFNAALDAARAGQLGEARLYMERAHVLRPFDREISDALNLIKQGISRTQMKTLDGEEFTEGTPPQINTWRLTHFIPERLSALLLLAGLWGVAFAYLSISSTAGKHRRTVGNSMIVVCSLVILIFGSLWAGARWTASHVTPAVVTAPSPTYQDTPDTLGDEKRSTELYEGALVTIEARADRWRRITLADEQQVWVPAEFIRPLVPQTSNRE